MASFDQRDRMVRAMQAGQTRFDTCGTSASDRKASFRAGVLTRDAGPCHFDGRRTGFLEGHGGVNMDPPNLVGVVASFDGVGRMVRAMPAGLTRLWVCTRHGEVGKASF